MSKLIPLSRGLSAIVDDEDYDYLMQWNWFAHMNKTGKTYYAFRNINKNNIHPKNKKIKMHRVIMKTDDPEEAIDHKNHNGLDNRKENLRICTHGQNSINRRKNTGKTSSKYVGVTWDKSRCKWACGVRDRENNKYINLGRFDSELEAAQKRDEYARIYYGEFANLNFK